MPRGVKHKERVRDRAHLEFNFRLGVAEGRKIMFSQEVFRSSAQIGEVKFARNVMSETVVEGRTVWSCENPIPIVFALCVKARMETVCSRFDSVDTNGWREQRIDGLAEVS